MDTIIIEDLEIYGYHGVFPEENVLGQKFIFSLKLYGDFRLAGKTEDLTKSIHYGEVCKLVEEHFLKKNNQLIETCGEEICQLLFETYPLIQSINLVLKKPWAPIGSHLDYAAVELNRSRHYAYIGIGSNLGDTTENVRLALDALNTTDVKVLAVSQKIITKPWGVTDQPDFLNCVAKVETLLTPKELLHYLQSIEKNLKRERLVHWGPRTIDLDILLFDHLITDDPELVIPHPQMEHRLFVLTPLKEIAPFVVHPLLNKRIFQLEAELLKQEKE